jgi:hypothetical protein
MGNSTSSAAFEAWKEHARSVRIEHELDRRGIRLKRVGAELVGPCPKCGGDDRFAVHLTKQVFNCRHCNVGGDVIALVQLLDDCDFMAACTTLAGNPPKANGKNDDAGVRDVVVATFTYENADGSTAFVVDRIQFQKPDGTWITKHGKQKTFRQKRPGSNGSWIENVKDAPVVPYRLPELIEAVGNGNTVCVVEGEGKADLLHSWNIAATCCAMGAGKWKSEHSEYLRDADVVILPDNDVAGRKHVDVVAASLQAVGAKVRVLELPDLPDKGDIVNWAKAGGTVEKLHDLIEQHEAKPWAATEQGTSTPNTWRFYTGEAPPPPRWLIKGILPENGVALIAGQWGTYKTTVALDFAISIMAGTAFAQHYRIKRHGAVLYIALEGEGMLAARKNPVPWTRQV